MTKKGHSFKATDMGPQLFYSKLTDVKCTIKKQYISHPLMEGVAQEFVVDNRNTWDPHPINITNMAVIEKNYQTLAESERGAQVAIHFNTLAVQFQVEHKYGDTVQILTNYVQSKLAEIQNSASRIDIPLDEAIFKLSKV